MIGTDEPSVKIFVNWNFNCDEVFALKKIGKNESHVASSSDEIFRI
jgi:hypothetical protein